jgi:uncharacterized membrane protein YeaQ/YmgE (transglycosylase-associated protein family)
VLGFLLTLALIGLFVGFLARALVPGPDPMGLLGTMALGIAGAFVGGWLLDAVVQTEERRRQLVGPGIIGSTIGAILLLLVLRLVTRSGARR